LTYRNKVTGQEITVASEIIGGSWEPVADQKPAEKAVEEAEKRKPGRKSTK